MHAGACGPGFLACSTCTRSFLAIKIRAREVSPQDLVCPSTDCRATIQPEDVLRILDATPLWPENEAQEGAGDLLSIFVEVSSLCACCAQKTLGHFHGTFPSPCQARAAWAEADAARALRVGSGEAAGGLVQEIRRFAASLSDAAALARWSAAVDTRRCPGCSALIEKNGGCNHMTCRSCKHQFNWCCGQPWGRTHNDFICAPFYLINHPRYIYLLFCSLVVFSEMISMRIFLIAFHFFSYAQPTLGPDHARSSRYQGCRRGHFLGSGRRSSRGGGGSSHRGCSGSPAVRRPNICRAGIPKSEKCLDMRHSPFIPCCCMVV